MMPVKMTWDYAEGALAKDKSNSVSLNRQFAQLYS